MTPQDYERAIDVFLRACDLPRDERNTWLEHEYSKTPGLREEVDRLIHAHDASTSLLDRPIVQPLDVINERQEEERTLPEADGYQFVSLIGRGASGEVYEGVQLRPARRVAIKVLRQEYAATSFKDRFEREAASLASFRHRNIATVFAVGACADGRPFIAMEHINGKPLLDYIDDHPIELRARLSLVDQLCDAIQHAHDRMIIHRDLKPTNVLVTDDGTETIVKVIDFGIGRALGQEHDLTIPGQLVGTPLYMSPEQAGLSDEPLTTRSDVYSIGVILFEVLTGTTPFCLAPDESVTEVLHRKRAEDPPRLSSRARGEWPARCIVPVPAAKLAGDLDAIVMKALAREPDDRYESARALRDDLERHLYGKPVSARPATALYELSRVVRRHRGLAWSVGAAALVVVISTILIGLAQQRAVRATREAELQLDRATLAWAASAAAQGDERTAGTALDQVRVESRGLLWRCLDGLTRGAFRTVLMYEGGIAAAARLPDGVVFACREDQLWRLDDGADVPEHIVDIDGAARAVAAPPSGAWVAAIDRTGRLQIISTSTARPYAQRDVELGGRPCEMIGVDDNRLLVRTADALSLFDIPSLRELWRLDLPTSHSVLPVLLCGASVITSDPDGVLIVALDGTVMSRVSALPRTVALARAGEDILAADADGDVLLYRTTSGSVEPLVSIGEPVRSLRVDVDRGLLFVCTNQAVQVRAWSTCALVASLPGSGGMPRLVRDDGQFVDVFGENGIATRWILDNGSVLGGAVSFFVSHESLLPSHGVSPSPFGSGAELPTGLVVTADRAYAVNKDGLSVHERNQWRKVWTGQIHPACRPSASEAGVAWFTKDSRVLIHRAGQDVRELGQLQELFAIAISPDGDRVSCGSASGDVFVLNTSHGEETRRISTNSVVRALCMKDRSTVFIGDQAGTLWRWDIDSDRLTTLGQGPSRFSTIVVDAAGVVISGHEDGSLAFWREGAEHPTTVRMPARIRQLCIANNELTVLMAGGVTMTFPLDD